MRECERAALSADDAVNALVRPATSLLDAIGHTPLVWLAPFGRELAAPILVKCEHMSPDGSIKAGP